MELEEITLLTVVLRWNLLVKLNPAKDKIPVRGQHVTRMSCL